MVIRIVGMILVAMGFFTVYFAHKHGRLEAWSIACGASFAVAGIVGLIYASWWPILAGALVGMGIHQFGGVAADRR